MRLEGGCCHPGEAFYRNIAERGGCSVREESDFSIRVGREIRFLRHHRKLAVDETVDIRPVHRDREFIGFPDFYRERRGCNFPEVVGRNLLKHIAHIAAVEFFDAHLFAARPKPDGVEDLLVIARPHDQPSPIPGFGSG